jgi:hypothetical protein
MSHLRLRCEEQHFKKRSFDSVFLISQHRIIILVEEAKHMLTITPEAKAYALDNGGTVFLEYYILTGGCCVPFQPEPTVRFGKPKNHKQYKQETIDGLTVFIPCSLPDIPLVISVASYLGIKRLVIEGWHHF